MSLTRCCRLNISNESMVMKLLNIKTVTQMSVATIRSPASLVRT